jgi:chemotaxis family two-component system response regulator Rcp1
VQSQVQKKAGYLLVVEDNLADQSLIREALKGEALLDLFFVGDGQEALNYLSSGGCLAKGRMPNLILLDLNLPKIDGRQLLTLLKADPKFVRVPVVIFSTSNSLHDISESYRLGANAFAVKPDDVDAYFSTVQSITRFWFEICELPDAFHEAIF